MKYLLLVEDEPHVAAFIKKGLREEGYEVLTAYDGRTGLELLAQHQVDLIILDLILPDLSGLEICHKIRTGHFKSLPILMLTALDSTENIVKGLDSGADDYLPKPFKFQELLARIRALLRRNETAEAAPQKLVVAKLELNLNTKVAIREHQEIKLTATEYRLLEYFMSNPNRVLSRNELLENVWDINFNLGTNVVDVYVNYLRNKVDKGFSTKLLQTVIGMGYIFKEEQ